GHLGAAHARIRGPVRGRDRGGARALRCAQRSRVLLRHRPPWRDVPARCPARRLVARPDPRGAGGPAPVLMIARVSIHAYAKLLLLLRALSRETDGFHGLETLFCLIDLADSLGVERRDKAGITIDVEGAGVDAAGHKLV